jgi:predicted lipoprotein with Yx(FWY)xxD motif
MQRSKTFRLPRTAARLVLLAIAATALIAAGAAGAGASATKRVAKEAQNATLGKSILTTTKGRTLYSLSAETRGRFICTGSCLSIWHPLFVSRGVKPTGPVKLGTIERPEGKTQVTFKGRPLYSFGGDSKAGEVNGEGIMDVGTWHAAAVSKAAPQPQPEEEGEEEPSYPY